MDEQLFRRILFTYRIHLSKNVCERSRQTEEYNYEKMEDKTIDERDSTAIDRQYLYN